MPATELRGGDPFVPSSSARGVLPRRTPLRREWRHDARTAYRSPTRPRPAPPPPDRSSSGIRLRRNSYVCRSASKRPPPCRNCLTCSCASLPPWCGRNPRPCRYLGARRFRPACPCRQCGRACAKAAGSARQTPPPWPRDQPCRCGSLSRYPPKLRRRRHCGWRLAPAPACRRWLGSCLPASRRMPAVPAGWHSRRRCRQHSSRRPATRHIRVQADLPRCCRLRPDYSDAGARSA